jgi:hypothetical protein
MGRRFACTFLIFVGLSACTSSTAVAPDACDLEFRGEYRKLVKLRDPSLRDQYSPLGTSQTPLTVASLIAHGCDVTPQLPANVDKNTPTLELEQRLVTIKGFIQAVRFEHGIGRDNDFHIEISDVRDWNSPHVVVEVPPGQPYCDGPRKAIWDLVKRDAAAMGITPGETHFFRDPQQVQIVGFLFFDGQHRKKNAACTSPGRFRGIHDRDHPKQVQGLWEVHPVIAVNP